MTKAQRMFIAFFVSACLPLSWAAWYIQTRHILRMGDQPWAPRYHGRTFDGKDYSMLDLSQKGSQVVCFINLTDPDTVPIMDRLALLQKSNPDDLTVVTIVRGAEYPVYAWAKKNSKGMPVISDAYGTFARNYKAKQSGTLYLIGRDTLLHGTWTEFTTTALDQLNKKLAEIEDRPAKAVSFGAEEKLGRDSL